MLNSNQRLSNDLYLLSRDSLDNKICVIHYVAQNGKVAHVKTSEFFVKDEIKRLALKRCLTPENGAKDYPDVVAELLNETSENQE